MKNTNDNRASEDALAELHGTIAQILTKRLHSGEASTADINAAIKFLKDNAITCVGNQNSDIQDLVASLPVYDET